MAASSVTGKGCGSAESPIRGLSDLNKILSKNGKRPLIDSNFSINEKISGIIESKPNDGDILVWSDCENKWIASCNKTGFFENKTIENLNSILSIKKLQKHLIL